MGVYVDPWQWVSYSPEHGSEILYNHFTLYRQTDMGKSIQPYHKRMVTQNTISVSVLVNSEGVPMASLFTKCWMNTWLLQKDYLNFSGHSYLKWFVLKVTVCARKKNARKKCLRIWWSVWAKSKQRQRIFICERMMKDWGVREQVVVIMPVHYSTWSSLWHN